MAGRCKVTFQIEKDSWNSIGIVGSTKELGCWNIQSAIMLKKSKDKLAATVNLEKGQTVQYRYFQANVINKVIFVTSWESLEDGRMLKVPGGLTHVVSDGKYGQNCSPGWLTNQSELRIYLSSCAERPLLKKYILETDTSNLKMNVSATPVFSSKLIKLAPCMSNISENKNDTKVEIPQNEDRHFSFVFQYSVNTTVDVLITILEDENVLGTATLSTATLVSSKGTSSLSVVKDGKSVAEITVGYAVIHPFVHALMDAEKSQNVWKRNQMLLVGHRGCGNSFTSKILSDYRENSVAGFRKVADKPGAFVEFDVHLTKNSVPIVYHDLTTCLQTSKKDGSIGLAEVPVFQLLLDEVQTMRTKHKSRRVSKRPLAFDEDDFVVNPPFPTLAEVLEDVPESVGFNIELKYPALGADGEYENNLRNYIDANYFLDQILQVVYDHGKSRRGIFFSSFDVDICIMARKKQSRYPVFLLTNGNTSHYSKMMDVRERTNEMALATAGAEGLIGINSLENDLYETPEIVEKVHEAGLVMAFYGDRVIDNLALFDEKNVDVAIYDRIHTIDYTPQERKRRQQE